MVEPVKATGTTISEFRNEPVAVQFYMGLENYELFCNILASLGPSAFELNYLYGNPTLTVEDHLFITLMKLRTYKTNFELSLMFKISESEVYNVFITWIKFMALQWREINIWPEREIVTFYAPSNCTHKGAHNLKEVVVSSLQTQEFHQHICTGKEQSVGLFSCCVQYMGI